MTSKAEEPRLALRFYDGENEVYHFSTPLEAPNNSNGSYTSYRTKKDALPEWPKEEVTSARLLVRDKLGGSKEHSLKHDRFTESASSAPDVRVFLDDKYMSIGFKLYLENNRPFGVTFSASVMNDPVVARVRDNCSALADKKREREQAIKELEDAELGLARAKRRRLDAEQLDRATAQAVAQHNVFAFSADSESE
jgi:hypothetical protein